MSRIEDSIQSAVQAREAHLRRVFTDSLGGEQVHDKFALEQPPDAVADQVIQARERVLHVIRQVAHALVAIHGRGVIHRDLKPANVMRRPDGSVALADFGVAKTILQAENVGLAHTCHGDVVGTPYYLSPEQATGGEITPQSDLYSLGVMMFEMLAGRRPFPAESLDVLLARHLSAPTPSLPAAHAALQPVVDRLMAKQPRDRYASAGVLLADLDPWRLLRAVTEDRPGSRCGDLEACTSSMHV